MAGTVEQLEAVFAQAIDRGELAPGSRLPSIRVLARERNVSHVTAARAVRRLVERGLVTAVPGSGTYVNRPGDAASGDGSPSPRQARQEAERPVLFVHAASNRLYADGDPMSLFGGVRERLGALHRPERFLPQDELRWADWLREEATLFGAILTRADQRPAVSGKGMAPLVLCGQNAMESDLHAVGPDLADGARQVTRYLLDQGHRRIVFVCREDSASAGRVGPYAGYATTMAAASCSPLLPVRWEGLAGSETLAARMRDVLANAPGAPTALVAADDALAVEVLDFVRGVGVEVPERLSLVGLEDAPCAAEASPAITTAGYDRRRAGREAVDLLMRVAANPDLAPLRILLPMKLMVRDSVRALAQTESRFAAPVTPS